MRHLRNQRLALVLTICLFVAIVFVPQMMGKFVRRLVDILFQEAIPISAGNWFTGVVGMSAVAIVIGVIRKVFNTILHYLDTQW